VLLRKFSKQSCSLCKEHTQSSQCLHYAQKHWKTNAVGQITVSGPWATPLPN